MLARNAELARRAAATDCEQHRTGRVAAARRADLEIGPAARYAVDALSVVDAQAGSLCGSMPKREQLLLAHLPKLDGSDQRQRGRRRHDELAARIVGDRAAEAVLLNGDKTQPVLHGRETR